jgi:hypothetical protein
VTTSTTLRVLRCCCRIRGSLTTSSVPDSQSRVGRVNWIKGHLWILLFIYFFPYYFLLTSRPMSNTVDPGKKPQIGEIRNRHIRHRHRNFSMTGHCILNTNSVIAMAQCSTPLMGGCRIMRVLSSHVTLYSAAETVCLGRAIAKSRRGGAYFG